MRARRSQQEYRVRCNEVSENKLPAAARLFVLSKTPPFPGNDTKAISLRIQTTWSCPRCWNCAAKANGVEPRRSATLSLWLICSSSRRELRAFLKINDLNRASNSWVNVMTWNKQGPHVNQEKRNNVYSVLVLWPSVAKMLCLG